MKPRAVASRRRRSRPRQVHLPPRTAAGLREMDGTITMLGEHEVALEGDYAWRFLGPLLGSSCRQLKTLWNFDAELAYGELARELAGAWAGPSGEKKGFKLQIELP